MKTPCYGLVALTRLALTIVAPTTVAQAQAYSALYDLGMRVGDPKKRLVARRFGTGAVMGTCTAPQHTVE